MDAKNVNEIIDVLAIRFGSTGAHLWGVLQRQAYVEAALAVVAWALVAGIGMLLRRAMAWADDAEGINQEVDRDLVAVGITVLVAVGAVVAVVQTFIGISAVLNPEYFALMAVLGAL